MQTQRKVVSSKIVQIVGKSHVWGLEECVIHELLSSRDKGRSGKYFYLKYIGCKVCPLFISSGRTGKSLWIYIYI